MLPEIEVTNTIENWLKAYYEQIRRVSFLNKSTIDINNERLLKLLKNFEDTNQQAVSAALATGVQHQSDLVGKLLEAIKSQPPLPQSLPDKKDAGIAINDITFTDNLEELIANIQPSSPLRIKKP